MGGSTRPIQSDPEIMGGTPVFVGTRVPFQNLLDCLQGGETIGDFPDDFPSVTREQVVESPRQAGQMMVMAHACPA